MPILPLDQCDEKTQLEVADVLRTGKRPPKYKLFGFASDRRPMAQVISRPWYEWNKAHRGERKRAKREQIIDRDGLFCGICRQPVVDVSEIEIDHIRPMARGGKSTSDNLQVAHRACNRRKGAA